MTSKIFRSILTASAAVLAAALIVITGFLSDYFTDIQVKQLRDELSIAAKGAEQSGINYLEMFSESEHFRITWVAQDGKVLFDSRADESGMENHLDREEIREAIESGTGSSSRYSRTFTEKTLYEAELLSDGTVLRISVSRASGMALMLGMIYPIIIIGIVAIIASAILAKQMSKRITKPLNELDLDNPLENDAYEEIAPLLGRIHRQHKSIELKAEELKRKKEEFSFVTESMHEGLVLLDRYRQILSINPAAMKIFGANKRCIGEDFLVVDRKQDMTEAIDKALRTGHSEFRAVRNDREYQFDISRIDNDGETAGAVMLAHDITEQANAERIRREFSANVSHELKTPLQSIMGSAELLENGLVKAEDTQRFLGHIRKEAERLVTLVDDIIRLSQLDEGGEMPYETVSLRQVTGEVFSALKSAAAEKNIELSVQGESAEVSGVKRLIYEILYNLCDNGIKYSNDGGKVMVSIRETEEEAEIEVADRGIGIPAEHRSRIFERFYRVDKSHSRKSGGTGLGLSIVKNAVKYLGGRVELESEEGNGTKVTVTLPKLSQKQNAAKAVQL
ncbi:MAG: ATP-binding protein [Ruminococcus sp.]